uniref:Uncharacterized protein n=1 Tax=Arundo donax TaxID=35708 RepID=A0A0A9GDM2_ARUDO
MLVHFSTNLKKTDPVLEAPTQDGVRGKIIIGKPYPCNVQCREAASNLRSLGTSGITLPLRLAYPSFFYKISQT